MISLDKKNTLLRLIPREWFQLLYADPENPDNPKSYTYSLNLETIADSAFYWTELSEIFIPESVSFIHPMAFRTPSAQKILGFYGSYAIEWAKTNDYEWAYQPCVLTMKANPPPVIQQYIPVEFVVKTRIPNNEGLVFTIEPELPPGLEFDTDTGTISGVITDSSVVSAYNGREYTITANAAGLSTDIYAVSVVFPLELAGVPTGDIIGWPEFDDIGEIITRIGGEDSIIEVDEDGNLLVSPVVFEMNAPFLEEELEDGSYWEFHEFYINGIRQTRGTVKDDPDDGDYYAEEGSTVITIRDKTMQALPDGDHTATATFRRTDSGDSDVTVSEWNDLREDEPWDVRVEAVSQNFTRTTISNDGNSGNTGGNTGDNTGNTNDNTDGATGGNTGDNTGNTGSTTGGNTGNTSDNTGSNTSNTGDNTGNTGSTTGSNTGNTGGNTGSNTGNTGGSTGGQFTPAQPNNNTPIYNTTETPQTPGTQPPAVDNTGGNNTQFTPTQPSDNAPELSQTPDNQPAVTQPPAQQQPAADNTAEPVNTAVPQQPAENNESNENQQPTNNQQTGATPENNNAGNDSGSSTANNNVSGSDGNSGNVDNTSGDTTAENIIEGSFILPGDESITFIGETIIADKYTQTIVSGLSAADDGRYYFVLDGSGAPFEISIDIAFEEFRELYMNGIFWVSGIDYTVRSGSTIITVSAERLEHMSMGYHTISAVFLNETVDIIFDLVKPLTTAEVAAVKSNPRTGDSVLIMLCVLFLLTGSSALYIKRRKIKKEVR